MIKYSHEEMFPNTEVPSPKSQTRNFNEATPDKQTRSLLSSTPFRGHVELYSSPQRRPHRNRIRYKWCWGSSSMYGTFHRQQCNKKTIIKEGKEVGNEEELQDSGESDGVPHRAIL
ncbi:hypothetical protein BDZ45DRAFT_742824 [Acephala macrosclerotiorum]|nr:hypothetical protein BDZ45DRAFT_742824 [Acephala macrosclerotiorum]